MAIVDNECRSASIVAADARLCTIIVDLRVYKLHDRMIFDLECARVLENKRDFE